MGNITGAMVFQSAIPTSIGLVLAPSLWSVGGAGLAFASAAITFASTGAIALTMVVRGRLGPRPLLIGGAFYLSYVLVVIAVLVHPA